MAGTDPIFLDASGLVALLNADDWLHEAAARQFESIGVSGQNVITTNLVLAEMGNGLARTPARAVAANFIQDVLAEPKARVFFIDNALMKRGLARYADFADKSWGLTDCISFEVMESTGCREAFTHDHHFEQAGFVATLR